MSDRPGRESRSGASWRDDRAWQAGLLIGSALGAAATVVGRRMEQNAREGLVDWPAVERIAIARLRSAPGSLTAADLRAAEPAYLAAMDRIVPALSAALGTELPGVVERSGVVDRADWVRANTTAFESLIGKLEADLLDQVVPVGGGLAKATMALANRWITTRQLGLLLGFLGQRVLGQYDLALLSAESKPGRLLFVEENIRQTAVSRSVSRWPRSGPGSPCTRPRMPSSSRPTRGCGPISPSAWSARSRCSGATSRGWVARPCAVWVARCAARGVASTGWSG